MMKEDNKCKMHCKWLGYQYETDDLSHIVGQDGYKCEKYKKTLGNKAIKCEECRRDKRYVRK